ncbi:MAG TPA: MBL fold metallo-hydrolase [Candidatus Sulfotelmatobacter sp.]|nr:MBL fold metallo-hydrolase [Candidatus Sulfotelmatobacter sp.]
MVATSSVTIVIDPVKLRGISSASKVLVSHAHSDHTRGFRHKGMKLSTTETKEIHSALNSHNVSNFQAIDLNRKVAMDDMEVKALNAGHMLGSAQFMVRTPESSILYTGDINCVDTLTTKAAQPHRCDVLVIEATYGSPFYHFPSRETVYANVVEWAVDMIKQGYIPCLHVYAAGKAQEIVRLFNVYTHLPVIVNPILDGVNMAYQKAGHALDWMSAASIEGGEVLEKNPCVYVTTPNDRRSIGRKTARAFATGWALSMRGRNAAFPLSSHADFEQLVSFIKACNPGKVYIFTGFAEELRRLIRTELGLEAKAVPSMNQRTLSDDY